MTVILLMVIPLIIYKVILEAIDCRNYFVAISIGLAGILFFFGSFIILSYINDNDTKVFFDLNNFMNFFTKNLTLNKTYTSDTYLYENSDYFKWRALEVVILGIGVFEIAISRVSTPYDETNECWLNETVVYFSAGTAVDIYQAIQMKNYNYLKTLTPIEVINENDSSFVRIKLFANLEESNIAYIQIVDRTSKYWWVLTKVKYEVNQIPIEIAEDFLYTKELKTPNNSI